MSALRDFPLPYDKRGGSLQICFNLGWFRIRYHFSLGSHMPPNYLRHSRRYCLGYRFDVRTYAAGNNNHRGPLRRQAWEVDLCSAFAGTSAVKACHGCCCRQRMFSTPSFAMFHSENTPSMNLFHISGL